MGETTGRYPHLATNVVVKVFDDWLNRWGDLYTSGAISDHRNFLIGRIEAIIPIRGMKHFPVKFFTPGNAWPPPFIDQARSLDKHFSIILNDLFVNSSARIFMACQGHELFHLPDVVK